MGTYTFEEAKSLLISENDAGTLSSDRIIKILENTSTLGDTTKQTVLYSGVLNGEETYKNLTNKRE